MPMSDESQQRLAVSGIKVCAAIIGGPLGWFALAGATILDWASKEEAALQASQKAQD